MEIFNENTQCTEQNNIDSSLPQPFIDSSDNVFEDPNHIDQSEYELRKNFYQNTIKESRTITNKGWLMVIGSAILIPILYNQGELYIGGALLLFYGIKNLHEGYKLKGDLKKSNFSKYNQ